MQFLIDTDTESRAGLLMAAQVMALLANGMTEETQGATDSALARPAKPLHPPAPPIGKPAPAAPVIPLPPNSVPPPPVVHPDVHPDALPKEEEPAADVPAGTELDPAAVFGGARPLVPPPPADVSLTGAPPATIQASAAATPSATPAETTIAPVTAERDSAGLPWDERIHSETRKKNADGTWRYRRNLDANVKAAVTNELKAQYSAQQVIPSQPAAGVPNPVQLPPTAAAVPPPPAAAGVVPPPPADVAPTATVLPFPAQPAAAVPVQSAPAVGVPNAPQSGLLQTVTSFRDLMTKVNVALAAGKLTQAQLSEACKSAAGVDGVTALAAQPNLVPQVDAYLNRFLAA